MNLLQRSRRKTARFFERVKSFIFSTFPAVQTYWIGLSATWTRPSYEKIAEKTMRNPYAQTAFTLISSNLAAIAQLAKVKRPNAEGELEDVKNHPLLQLLKRPNADQGTISFFKEMVAHLCFGGVVVIWNLGVIGRFNPSSLRLVRPDRLQQVKRNEQTLDIESFRGVDMIGRPWTAPASDVLYIVNYNPLDDNIGFPLFAPLLQALDLFDNMLEWSGSISQHKGRVPGFFISPHVMEDEQFKRMQDRIQNQYSKNSGSSQPMLLEDGLEFKETAISPEHAQMKDVMVSLVRMIAIGAGIDPALLGDNANKTYSNYQEAVRALIQLKVLPLLEWIFDEMTNWYMPKYNTPDDFLAIDEGTIKQLREDLNEKMKRLVDGVAGSVLTPDEARDDLGKDPKGGLANELLAKVGTVALDEAGFNIGLQDDDEAAAEKVLMTIHKMLAKEAGTQPVV